MLRDGCTRMRSRWRREALAGVLGVLAVATAVRAASPEPAATTEAAAGPRIEITHHEYSPATLTVPVGATVTWINHDDDVHTVTSSARVFVSGGLDTDEAFAYTFTAPGAYTYFCTLHPFMTATIVVK